MISVQCQTRNINIRWMKREGSMQMLRVTGRCCGNHYRGIKADVGGSTGGCWFCDSVPHQITELQ